MVMVTGVERGGEERGRQAKPRKHNQRQHKPTQRGGTHGRADAPSPRARCKREKDKPTDTHINTRW
jgi:hypothetical protein